MCKCEHFQICGVIGFMCRKSRGRPSRKFVFAVFLLALSFVMIPMVLGSVYDGDDLFVHLGRIEGIKDGLLSGAFPVRINPFMLNSYGLAIPLGYPETFLYIPAVLRILGLSVETSYKLFLMICIAGAYWSAYFCGKKIGKSRYCGLVTAFIYTTSSYFLANLYVRAALGEIQAFVFIPLVVYGLYDFVWEDAAKWWYLAIGFAGLMLCHSITLVIAVILCTLLCLIYIKRIFFTRTHVFTLKKIRSLFYAVGTVALTTCFFWLPFLELITAHDLAFHHSWSHIEAKDPFLISRFTIGISVVILCVSLIFLRKKIKALWFFLIGGVFSLFFTTALMPWDLLRPYLNNIQFPWRFLSMATFFLAVAIALVLHTKYHRRQVRELALIGVIAVSLLGSYMYLSTYVSDRPLLNYTPEVLHSSDSPINEWLPASISQELLKQEQTAISTDLSEEIAFVRDGVRLNFLWQDEKGHTCHVPLIYYKGYTAYLTDEEGNQHELPVLRGADALIELDMGGLPSGKVTVDYTGTTLQKASLFISGSSLAVLAICACLFFRRKRRPHRCNW